MASDRTKPLKDESALAGMVSSDKGCCSDSLPARIERYSQAKRRAKQNISYLGGSVEYIDPVTGEYSYGDTGALKRRLESCGNWLLFRNYYTLGETRLVKARFCMKHLLCPLCAIRRGAKSLAAYLARFEQINAHRADLTPYLLTLTVANGSDLAERFEHLTKSWKIYQDRRRQYFKRGRGFNELCKAEGAVFSYEFTHTPTGWHPHLHAIVLVDPNNPIDFDYRASGAAKASSVLSQEWLAITGDSSIVDCRPINTDDPAKSFAEVFKYALKFQDLTPEQNYIAYRTLQGKRLQGSFGLFWGVKVPDKLTDDIPQEELPYIELLYHYTSAGYSITEHSKHEHGEPKKVRQKRDFDKDLRQANANVQEAINTKWWLASKRGTDAV